MNDPTDKRLNVAIFQPALPKYRIPIFQRLGQQFSVKVFFGEEKDLSNEQAVGFENQPVKHRKFRLRSGREVIWNRSQIKACGNRHWDVIVLSWNIGDLSLIFALLRARLNGISTILWGHGYSKKASGFRARVRNRITGFATAVLFYDPVTKNKFEEITGRQNCFAAPNAINTDPIQEQKEAWMEGSRLERFKEEHDLLGRDVLLFVSRFDPANRLEVLIRAMPELKAKHPEILAVLVGSGQDEQRLRSLVKELDCVTNVLFTGPIYEEQQLSPWFLSASLFCYPSNIGLSLMHAFHYGLPVVVGDDLSRCNPEIYAFETNVNGMTFEDGDSSSLAKCVLDLIRNQSLLKALSKGAADTAKSLTIERLIDGYSEAIRFAAQSRIQKK